MEQCHLLLSSVVGSWVLPIVLKEEKADGAAAPPRVGKGSHCESRPCAAVALVGTEVERRSMWAAEGWQCYQKQNQRRCVAAGPKPKWFITGDAQHVLLCWRRLLKISCFMCWDAFSCTRGVLVRKSLRTRGCSAGWSGCWCRWPARLFWPDAASSPLPCSWRWCVCSVPGPRDVRVHTVIILQTLEITLHTSQNLAQRTHLGSVYYWEEKIVWLSSFLQPPSEISVQNSPRRLGGWVLFASFRGIFSRHLLSWGAVRPMRGLGLSLAAVTDVLMCPQHSKSHR